MEREKTQVLNRAICLAVALWIGGMLVPSARADVVTVEMFPFTGEVRLANADAAPFSFVFYSITSASPTLNGSPAVWNSITDDYDASGNGYIDPVNNWTNFASSSTQLAEGVILDPGGSLAPFRSVSLGQVWDAPPLPAITDLTIQVVQADYEFATVNRRLAIDGDYNQNGVVNMADYNEWKLRYGESGTIGSYRADGNLNGIVDAADYTIWRNNAGLALPGLALSSASGAELASFFASATSVPEPGTAMLMLSAVGIILFLRRSR